MLEFFKSAINVVGSKIKLVVDGFKAATSVVANHEFTTTMIKDASSQRILWTWIMGLFYMWITHYAVTHYKESANTAITSTATLAGVFFSVYVGSKTVEKWNGPAPTQPAAPAKDDSDKAA